MPLPIEGTRDTRRKPYNTRGQQPIDLQQLLPMLDASIGGFSPAAMQGMPIYSPPSNMLGTGRGNFDAITGEAAGPPGVVPGTQFSKARPGFNQGPELSPIQIALAQLDELLNNSVPMPEAPSEQDLQTALEEAAAGIRQQYGAQIGSIRNQNQGAREDVAEGSAAIQQLYRGLDRSFRKAGKAEARQGRNLSNQLQNIGERGAQAVTSQAKEMNDAALAGAAGLGLAGLGSELTNKTNANAQQLGNRSISRGTNAATATSRIAGNNRTFFNTSGKAARLEGVNRSADMYADLQDYLQANRDQIAQLAGERAAAIAQAKAGIQSGFAGAQSDYYDMATEQQQSLFDNKLALLDLAIQAENQGDSPVAGEDKLEQFYDMLPPQMAGPSRILSQMDDPTVSGLYEQLSNSSGMQLGYTGDREADTDVPLVDNLANVQQYASGQVGSDVWGQLTTAQRNAIVAALLSQLQGFGY